MSKELLEGVKALEKERGIEAETLLSAIEEALLAAYKKMPDARHPVRVDLDRESGDYVVWSVNPEAWESYLEAHPHHRPPEVEEVVEPAVPLAEGEQPEEEPEPEIEWAWFKPAQMVDVTPEGFSRIAGQTAKQVLRQRIHEAERSIMYDEYADRVGEIVTGIVQQDDNRYAFVDLGKMEAILPGSEKVPGERYEQGSRIKAVIIEVRSRGQGPAGGALAPQRRPDPPAVRAGGAGDRRRAGRRSVPSPASPATAPRSRSSRSVQGVDPVGACVGPRGSRVRMVVSELRGEKIDIIPWNDEPARFVAKALAPAKVREVYVDDAAQQATVVVPDGELSLAIGKEGQNARLAHRLTGWRIDIVSETEHYAEDTDVPYTGAEGEEDEFPGRCIAVTSSGKRCPEPGPRRQPLLRRARSSRAGRQGGGSGRVVADPIRQCAGCGRRRPKAELLRLVRRRRDDRLRHRPAAAGARRLPVSRSGLPDAGDTPGGVGQAVAGASQAPPPASSGGSRLSRGRRFGRIED